MDCRSFLSIVRHFDDQIAAALTQALKENSAKVEDEVDAGELLHHLRGCANQCTAQVGRWVSDGS